MRTIILIMFCLSYPIVLIGQDKYYEWEGDQSLNLLDFWTGETETFAVGSHYNESLFAWESIVYQIGAIGPEYYFHAGDSPLDHKGFAIAANDSKIIVAGGMDGPNLTGEGPACYVYDRETEEIIDVVVSTYLNGRLREIANLADGGFLVTGYVFDPEPPYDRLPFLAKLSSDGAFLWEQVYTQYYGYSSLKSVYEMPTGELWIAGLVHLDFDDQEEPSGQGILISIDETGNIMEEYLYPAEQIDIFTSILQVTENEWVLAGGAEGDRDALIYLNGNKEVTEILPLGEPSGCKDITGTVLPNGNFALESCKHGPNAEGSVDAVIFIVDSTRTLIRTFEYDGSQSEYFYGIGLDSEGSLLFGGRRTSSENQAWMLKTNCMGFFTEPEASYDFSLNDLEIEFQNFSQFVYPDSTDGGHFIWEIDGEEFSRDENPSYTFTETGAFNISLKGIVCNDTSLYNQCISLDGSECWALGVNELAKERIIKISPNPTSDWITITTDNPISSVQIFDLNGRLVQEERDPEFSVSELSTAVYFLEIAFSNGDRIRKKLVKQ